MFTTWLLVFCLFPVSKNEVEHKPSPSGKFTAVLEKSRSAGSSKALYSVYVEQKSFFSNRPLVASFFDAQKEDKTDGIELDWVKPDVLRLRYLRAQQTSSHRSEVQCGDETIHVEIEEGAKDISAPSK